MKKETTHSIHSVQLTRLFYTVLSAIILLFGATSCGAPEEMPTPTPPIILPITAVPTATITPTPQPTSAPMILPPVVVEIDPPPFSDLPLTPSITLSFNLPVQRASVEGGLSSTPLITGSFEWLDDATVRFVPHQALPPTTHITFKLDNVTAENGLPMLQPVDLIQD